MTNKARKSRRNATANNFIKLRDGRKLQKPPAGGKFTKVQIRHAVQSVIAQQA